MLDVFFLRRGVLGGCAAAIASFMFLPARAEFPPEGAVPDPNNASIATGDYPTHDSGVVHTVFYFDCGTRNWVGVSVKASSGTQNSPAQAEGAGREYPPGPPTGSTRVADNPNRAFNKSTGQDFALRDGNWIDTKTGKVMKARNLCRDGGSTGSNTVKQPSASDEKPDHLPARPEFIPGPMPAPHP